MHQLRKVTRSAGRRLPAGTNSTGFLQAIFYNPGPIQQVFYKPFLKSGTNSTGSTNLLTSRGQYNRFLATVFSKRDFLQTFFFYKHRPSPPKHRNSFQKFWGVLARKATKSTKCLNSRWLPWRRGLVVSSPPVNKETGAIGREIEACQGILRVVAFN
jgi:hypothetical protein